MVVPHHPTASSIELWVGSPVGYTRPGRRRLRLVVSREEGGRQEIPFPDAGWESLGPDPTEPGDSPPERFFTKTQVVTGLVPDSVYRARLQLLREWLDPPTWGTLAQATFATLPARLPSRDSDVDEGERPFTILLGSCYWVDEDDGSVADRYMQLYRNPVERPHLKLLVGDQVYLDQPFWEFERRKSTWELTQFITARYRESWQRLRNMLSWGANMLTTDDHEYWNDYPNTPVRFLWGALNFQGFRRTMRQIATRFVAHVQRARAVESFTIGNPPQLSVFVADTRMHRERGFSCFMWDPDLDRLVAWLEGLKTPGVLALGQPLFTPPESRWSGLFGTDVEIADRNLPGFDQFTKLAKALQQSPHDVCVLSGDVHYGRVARVHPCGLTVPSPGRFSR